MNLQNRKGPADLENKLMVAKMRDAGKNSWRVWDGPVHTAVIKMASQG